jgi:hypothetical protein
MSGDADGSVQGRPHEFDPWKVNEESRRRQLREDGRRPLAANLAEGLALSEFLSTFTGSAWDSRKSSKSPSEQGDLEALEAAQDNS